MTTPNPWQDFLEEEPEIAYFGHQDQFGGRPAQNQYYQGAYQDVYNQYRGQLGSQALGGQDPTTLWTDFLSDFNFRDQFNQLSPSRRGETESRRSLVSPLQWLIPQR